MGACQQLSSRPLPRTHLLPCLLPISEYTAATPVTRHRPALAAPLPSATLPLSLSSWQGRRKPQCRRFPALSKHPLQCATHAPAPEKCLEHRHRDRRTTSNTRRLQGSCSSSSRSTSRRSISRAKDSSGGVEQQPEQGEQQQDKWRQRPPRGQYERLFSNLNEATMQHEPGSVTSSILLVAGTTVGAGILAIPAVTQESGFLASTVTCSACWLYMVTTGLLVAEVNVNTMCELGSGGVSLVSMAERTLGAWGVRVACGGYVFIHYALLVAYVARSSDIVAAATGLPPWAAATLFSVGLGSLCFFGSQRVIGAANGALVAGVVVSFAALLVAALDGVQLDNLLRADFSAVPASIPIIALSFVYQNVVPVVATNLEGDLRRVRAAIVGGTAIPLVMFLAWNAVILGSLPPPAPLLPGVDMGGGGVAVDAGAAAAAAAAITDPLLRLEAQSGSVGALVQVFSFFAIATSYIGFVLGLTDFLSDLLRLPAGRSNTATQVLPYALTVLPPVAMALLNPDIFFKALDVAGTYGVLVLFGIIPAAMAWSERYGSSSSSPADAHLALDEKRQLPFEPVVPGGRATLAVVLVGAGGVILNEILMDLLALR